MAADKGRPLQLVKLVFGETPSVEVEDEALDIITKKLRAMDVKQISLVSVMGAFRTGKSFLLDLMLRFLRYEAKCQKDGIEPEKFEPPERGVGEDGKTLIPCPLPAWITASGGTLEGVGDEPNGFKFKGGMDVCTEGIWVWSEPFLRIIDGKRVALLLMDTQGAWDSSMSKEQSATIFGLTAVLSCKQIYNISMQVQEDKVENLAYFMRFAQTAIQKAALDIPEGSVNKDDIERPFQTLDFLVRDWRNYKKTFTVQQCRDMMNEHLSRHMDLEKVKENSTAEVLASMFHHTGCFGLTHPGFAIEDEDWDGDLTVVEPDFIRLMDVYIRDVFQTNLAAKTILGADLSPITFPLIVKDFVAAFKDAAPTTSTFTQAITNSTVLMAKEQAMKSYTNRMDEELAKNPRGLKEELYSSLNVNSIKQVQEEFKRMTIFGSGEVRADTWEQIKESLNTISKRYSEDNARRLERALAAFANITIVGVSLFILDRVSDWTCDWWSQTCVELSKLMLMAYAFIFLYIGVQVYFLFNDRGKLAVAGAAGELWKECARLLGVYADLFKAVNWKDLPDVIKKVATGKLDEVLKLADEKKSAAEKKKN